MVRAEQAFFHRAQLAQKNCQRRVNGAVGPSSCFSTFAPHSTKVNMADTNTANVVIATVAAEDAAAAKPASAGDSSNYWYAAARGNAAPWK